MSEAIGVDLGGTKVAVMRVTDTGEIVGRRQMPTPRSADPHGALSAIAEAAQDLMSPSTTAVGIGAPGLVGEGGILRFAANLGWPETPVQQILSDALSLPVVVDNDATVAAWGEYRFGAGVGARTMLCATVGTGLGGGLVLNGRLFRGSNGLAAEIGHIIVEPGGPLCRCGNYGCWEQVASGTAIQRAGRGAIDEVPDSPLGILAGGDADSLEGPMVTQAAQAGDPVSIAILAEVGRRLGEGLAGLVNVLDPDTVVVGGGASAAGELLLGPARHAFAASIEGHDHRPPVTLVKATLGNDVGGIGAAILALDGPDVVWSAA